MYKTEKERKLSKERRNRKFLRSGYWNKKGDTSITRSRIRDKKKIAKTFQDTIKKPAKTRREIIKSRWTRSMDFKRSINYQSYISIKNIKGQNKGMVAPEKKGKRNSIERLFDQLIEKKRETQLRERHSLPNHKGIPRYRSNLTNNLSEKDESDRDCSSNFEKLRDMLSSIAYERDTMMMREVSDDFIDEYQTREMSYSVNKRNLRRKRNQR